MVATKRPTRKPPVRRTKVAKAARGSKRNRDAISMLRDDHTRVDSMFKRFATMKGDGETKATLVQAICS